MSQHGVPKFQSAPGRPFGGPGGSIPAAAIITRQCNEHLARHWTVAVVAIQVYVTLQVVGEIWNLIGPIAPQAQETSEHVRNHIFAPKKEV